MGYLTRYNEDLFQTKITTDANHKFNESVTERSSYLPPVFLSRIFSLILKNARLRRLGISPLS